MRIFRGALKYRIKIMMICAGIIVGYIALSVPIIAADSNNEPASLEADTVEYDISTGQISATGNILLKRGTSSITGTRATYNTKTLDASIEGRVIAVRDDLRITCDAVYSDGQEHMQAVGSVRGVQLDRAFSGEQVDYYPRQNDYVLLETGGTISNKDGVFSAKRLEGWLKDEYYVGTGEAHLISQPKDLEAGGNKLEYFGKDAGKAVLTGDAWAVQENNTLRSNKLTLYLAQNGQAAVEPGE